MITLMGATGAYALAHALEDLWADCWIETHPTQTDPETPMDPDTPNPTPDPQPQRDVTFLERRELIDRIMTGKKSLSREEAKIAARQCMAQEIRLRRTDEPCLHYALFFPGGERRRSGDS
jgi:hypothetical protein